MGNISLSCCLYSYIGNISLTPSVCRCILHAQWDGVPQQQCCSLLGIGEGDHALQCRTSRDECCKTLPNRFGDFFYPNGTKVLNIRSNGLYRNRGQMVMGGVTSPAGKYKCEIPDADRVT